MIMSSLLLLKLFKFLALFHCQIFARPLQAHMETFARPSISDQLEVSRLILIDNGKDDRFSGITSSRTPAEQVQP